MADDCFFLFSIEQPLGESQEHELVKNLSQVVTSGSSRVSLSLLQGASRETNEVAKVIEHGCWSTSWGSIHNLIDGSRCLVRFMISINANHFDSDKVTEVVENRAFFAFSVVVVCIYNCVGCLRRIIASMAVCCERSDVVVDFEANNISKVVHDGDWCAVVVVIDELARDLDVSAIHLFLVANICEASEVAEVIKDGHLIADFYDRTRFSQIEFLSVNKENMVIIKNLACVATYSS